MVWHSAELDRVSGAKEIASESHVVLSTVCVYFFNAKFLN